MQVVHIGEKDITLSEGTDGLKLAVSKTITLNLKKPFQGPAILAFALNLDQETKSFLFNASFQVCSINAPTWFEICAALLMHGVLQCQCFLSCALLQQANDDEPAFSFISSLSGV